MMKELASYPRIWVNIASETVILSCKFVIPFRSGFQVCANLSDDDDERSRHDQKILHSYGPWDQPFHNLRVDMWETYFGMVAKILNWRPGSCLQKQPTQTIPHTVTNSTTSQCTATMMIMSLDFSLLMLPIVKYFLGQSG